MTASTPNNPSIQRLRQENCGFKDTLDSFKNLSLRQKKRQASKQEGKKEEMKKGGGRQGWKRKERGEERKGRTEGVGEICLTLSVK